MEAKVKYINQAENQLGKVPLQSRELEEIVIGSLLIDYQITETAIANLIKDDFYYLPHQKIYQAIVNIYQANAKVEIVSVNLELERMGERDETGGPAYLLALSNKVVNTANFEYHVQQLKSISIKRSMADMANKISHKAYDITSDGKDDLAEVMIEAEELINRVIPKKSKSFKEKYLDTLLKIENNKGKPIGIETGFKKLDTMMSGLVPPDLTIIAAGPGEGKTTFALNIAKKIAIDEGDVLFFPLEMSEEQLIYKLISDEINVTVNDVRHGKFSMEECQNKAKIYDAKLNIFENINTLDEIIATCKYQASLMDIKLIVIDYLQLVELGAYQKRGMNRNNEITVISRKLKLLAKSLNIPVIALSQLNREKNRTTYKLSDLRESGAIEQDADNVLFIFRPKLHRIENYYLNDESILVNDTTAIGILAKCRLSDTGQFRLYFNGACSRFENYNESNDLLMPKPIGEPKIKPQKGDIPF